MSLPSHPPLLTPTELQQFEGPLIALANQSGGDLRKLFYAFFSFLNRRTDFYCILPDEPAAVGKRQVGFKEGQAEQILIASFRQFPLRRMGDKNGVGGKKAAAAKPATSPDKIKAADGENNAGTASREKTAKSSLQNSAAEGSKSDAKVKSVSLSEGTKEAAPKKSKNESKSSIRYTDEGRQVPVGNGGSTNRYVWTQTLEEAVVHIPVPEGTRAKELDVEISPSAQDHSTMCYISWIFTSRQQRMIRQDLGDIFHEHMHHYDKGKHNLCFILLWLTCY